LSTPRVIIVTGASSGIGRALAERAACAGWNVFAVGRRAERLAELERSVDRAAGTLATAALDLRLPGMPALVVQEAIDRFGRIDVLVNNAGTVAVGEIGAQSDDALREQFETHAIVPLALTREAMPQLRSHRGQVVFVGSGVARIPIGGLGAYPPAKAAVRNLARVLRNELRPHGVAVTYVDPGAVATEFMTRAGLGGPPRGIAASPQDVARRIFDGIEHRRSVVNAVPWQTAFVALGEFFPAITDFVMSRMPQLAGTKPALEPAAPVAMPDPVTTPAPLAVPDPVPPAAATPAPEAPSVPANDFERALDPLMRRMERANLRVTFVREVLDIPGVVLTTSEVALIWAGMPNKHERALTQELLDALAEAGFLERLGGERYRVVRQADSGDGAPTSQ
jgi:short-subunit dehydrogenase